MASLQIKYSFTVVLLAFLSFQAKSSNNQLSITDTINFSTQNYSYDSKISLADSIINFSKLYLGKPYRGGGKGPNSFDCSGFTSFVFSNFGVKLGSSSADQAEQVPNVMKEEIQPGDLVFYNGRRRGNRVGHVGLVVTKHENGEFDFIHSASSVGISISNSESSYYSRRYVGAGRAIPFDSLITRNNSNKVDYSHLTLPENEQNKTTVQPQTITTIVKKKVPAKYHTVKSGETLSEIASKYGLTVTQLKKKNQLKKDFLSLKQRLKIKDAYEINVIEKIKTPITILADTTSKSEKGTEKPVTEKQSTKRHTVKKGETLFSISKEYGISIDNLKENNNLNNGKIFVGQELALSTENKSLKAESVAKKKTKTHTVKSGETLSEIAEKYHCTVSELKKWNAKKSTKLSLGEKLKIII